MAGKTHFTRRDVLIGTAAAGLSALTAQPCDAEATNDDEIFLDRRRKDALELRTREAQKYSQNPLHQHPTNGDEELLPDYIGNYSKGLKHNGFGEVEGPSYRSLLIALRSGEPNQFEHIMLGHKQPSAPYEDLAYPDCDGKPPNVKRDAAHVVPFYRPHSERGVSKDNQALLVNPQAGLGFDLEGIDSHELVMPPPPAFQSKEIIAEIAENYWMALTRNIAFPFYGTDNSKGAVDPTIQMAADDLSTYDEYKGPRDQATGKVTPALLFRGTAPGEANGPYVSQFLLRPVPFGAYSFPQKLVFAYQGDPDFLIHEQDWLDAQSGKDNSAKNPPYVGEDDASYIYRGRDLANFVHIDELFQAYFLAALTLGADPSRGGLGAPHDSGNPYDGYHYDKKNKKHQRRASTQIGFGTLGEPNVKGLVTEVGTRALKAVWYQKWFVHRRLRPEEFAGRIHFNETKDAGTGKPRRSYPFDQGELDKLRKTILPAVHANNMKDDKTNDSYLLPMAFPEGCPLHPAYGAGHATVAGACVTILKALYEEEITFFDLRTCVYKPNEAKDRPNKPPLSQPPILLKPPGKDWEELAKQLTIGGELNKLASNVSLGRNIAGVHWRSDHAESLKLGERVALALLRETVNSFNEHVSFTVTKFDGTKEVIRKLRRQLQ